MLGLRHNRGRYPLFGAGKARSSMRPITESKMVEARYRAGQIMKARTGQKRSHAVKANAHDNKFCSELPDAWSAIEILLDENDGTITYAMARLVIGDNYLRVINAAVHLGLLRGVKAGVFERGEYRWGDVEKRATDPQWKRTVATKPEEFLPRLPNTEFDVGAAAKVFKLQSTAAADRLKALVRKGLLSVRTDPERKKKYWKKVQQ